LSTPSALPSFKAERTESNAKKEEENEDIHGYEWQAQTIIGRIGSAGVA
jgi:hypothetical protein